MKKILIIMLSFMLISCTQVNEVAENNPIETEVNNQEVVEEKLEEVVEEKFEYVVDINRAIDTIEWLTLSEYEGRQAGSNGNLLAENRLVEAFKDAGLQPIENIGYKQTYEQLVLLPEVPTVMKLEGEEPYEYQVQFSERFVKGRTDFEENIEAEMFFVKNINDLKEDTEILHNKVILLSRELYYNDLVWNEIQRLDRNDINIKAVVVNGGDDIRVTRAIRGNQLVEFDPEDPLLIFCRTDVFTQLMTSDKKLIIEMDFEEKLATPSNVVGMIEGQDEDGEGEVVIVGAHFDHVGDNLNGTYNPGALDNASGISIMLELAIAFKDAKPDNTIYFVAFNGEEDGLIGSEYFVDQSKGLFNSLNAVMLNFDMVGSTAEVPLSLGYVSSRDEAFCETVGEIATESDVNYILEEMYGSDHTNFSERGVPSVCFIQFDDAYYHTAGDTLENAVDKDRLNEVLNLAVKVLDVEANK